MLKPTKVTHRFEEVKRTKDGKIDMKQFSEDEMSQMRRTMLRVDAFLQKVQRRLQEEKK